MLLDSFLIMIGMKADTAPATEMQDALDGVTESANEAEAAAQGSGNSFASSFGKALNVVAAFAAVAKTALMGAWAYLDSTIDRVEELQNAENESIRTTKEQVEMAKKYRENMDSMGDTIDEVKTKIALGFLPVMLDLSYQFKDFLDDNKDLIANGLKVLLEWIAKVSQVISNFVRAIDTAIRLTIGWEKALYVLVAVLAFVKRAMIMAFITNPIAWVAAAIIGLMLLIDDFMTHLDGGESLFGEYWERLFDWIESVQEPISNLKDSFLDAFSAISEAFSVFLSAFTENFNLSDVFGYEEVSAEGEKTESVFISLVNYLRDFFQFLADNKDVIAGIGYAIGYTFSWLLELIIGVFSGAGRAVAGFVGFLKDSFDFLVALFSGNTDAMLQEWQEMTESAMNFFSGFFQFIGQILDSILQIFGSSVDQVANYFSNLYDSIVNSFSSILSFISTTLNSIVSIASSVVSSIGSVFSGVFDLITAPFARAIDWVSNKFSSLSSSISNGLSSLGSSISNATASAVAGGSSKTNNYYGGNVNANIKVSSPNAQQAATATVKQLNNSASFANKNLKGTSKA